MNGIIAKEAAEKWGITPRQVQMLFANGHIIRSGSIR